MGAATLRRGEQVLLPKTLPSVSGAEHQRALTDLRREMGLELSKAKKEGGYTQEDLDAAVDEARGDLAQKLNELQAKIAEQQTAIDAQQERIDALPDDADETASPEPDSTPEAAPDPPAEHHSQDMNANDAIEYLEGIDNVEDAEAMKVAEAGGRQRKGVLKAIDKHIAWLNEPD